WRRGKVGGGNTVKRGQRHAADVKHEWRVRRLKRKQRCSAGLAIHMNDSGNGSTRRCATIPSICPPTEVATHTRRHGKTSITLSRQRTPDRATSRATFAKQAFPWELHPGRSIRLVNGYGIMAAASCRLPSWSDTSRRVHMRPNGQVTL